MKKRVEMLVLLLAASLMAGCSAKGGNEEKDPSAGERVEKVITEEAGEETQEPAKEEGAKSETKPKAAKNYEIVANGVAYQIPGSFELRIDDETGNIYIDDGDLEFSLVMVVRDGSYEESLEDKDALTKNAREQDVTILKDITEYSAEGKSYAYFTFEYNDHSSTNTVIYTKATEDKRVGINMMINGDLTEEEVIDRINVFMKTAQPSDKADTTQDEIYEQAGIVSSTMALDGVEVSESEMKIGDTTIEVPIPEGFLYQDDMDSVEEGMFCRKYFTSTLCDADLTLYEEGMYTDLEELIESECVVSDEAKDLQVEGPKSADHNGNKILYKCASYTYDGTVFHKVMAAVELPDHSVFSVLAQNLDGEELSLDSVKDFLDVKTR